MHIDQFIRQIVVIATVTVALYLSFCLAVAVVRAGTKHKRRANRKPQRTPNFGYEQACKATALRNQKEQEPLAKAPLDPTLPNLEA